MGLRPLVPIRHRVAHRVEEVIRAAVTDELESLLEIGGERLVVGERGEVLLEALGALEGEQLLRVVDDGRDLGPAADEARVRGERVDLAVAHSGDALDIEAMEGRACALPLGVDNSPADPSLEDAFGKLLEVVVDVLGFDLGRSFHRRLQIYPVRCKTVKEEVRAGACSAWHLPVCGPVIWKKEQAMARKAGGGMTVAEAGRMGGRLVSEKYGPEFYERIGKKGGSSTATKYGPEFFGRIGKKGGRAVTAKYGAGHFERIGRKGGQKVADLIERAKTLDAAAEEPAPETVTAE